MSPNPGLEPNSMLGYGLLKDVWVENKGLVAVDIETSSLSAFDGQILEFGAIHVASGGVFRRLVLPEDGLIGGSPEALAMNAALISEISSVLRAMEVGGGVPTGCCYEDQLNKEFSDWLNQLGVEKLTVFGKNFERFDRSFLVQLDGAEVWNCRVLDLGSLCYPIFGKIASLRDILEHFRSPLGQTHRAVDDCSAYMWVLQQLLGR